MSLLLLVLSIAQAQSQELSRAIREGQQLTDCALLLDRRDPDPAERCIKRLSESFAIPTTSQLRRARLRLARGIATARRAWAREQLRRLTEEAEQSLDEGKDELAIAQLEAAGAHARSLGQRRLRRRLLQATEAVQEAARHKPRLLVDGSVGLGWSSSNADTPEPASSDLAAPESSAAAYLNMDFGVRYRMLGSGGTNWTIGYRLSQLAYLSTVHDSSCLQEHTIDLPASWTVLPRLSLQAQLGGSLLLVGVRGMVPYELALQLGAGMRYDQGASFDLRVIYQHAFPRMLGGSPQPGMRGDLRISQSWQNLRVRLSLDYALHIQLAGAPVPATDIAGNAVNASGAAGDAFQSHQGAVSALAFLPSALAANVMFSVERLVHPELAAIGGAELAMAPPRADARYMLSASLEKALPAHLSLEARYSLVATQWSHPSPTDESGAAGGSGMPGGSGSSYQHRIELSVSGWLSR